MGTGSEIMKGICWGCDKPRSALPRGSIWGKPGHQMFLTLELCEECGDKGTLNDEQQKNVYKHLNEMGF